MGRFIPNSRNRVGGGRHEVGGGRHIKTLALGEMLVGKMDKHIRAEDLRKRRNTIGVLGPHGRIYATFAK